MTVHPVFNSFPEIHVNDEIVLREIKESDAAGFYFYITDPEVQLYISDEDIPTSIDNAVHELRYWSSLFTHQRSIYWAIADKKTNTIIGTCGFNNWSQLHRRGEISYDLARNYWNKGIMTKVIKEMIKFSINNMGMERIQATVTLQNKASTRVLEKLGFKREGLLKHYAYLHGKGKDFYMYAYVKES